ncbi:DUF1573 domain-containing protein [Flavihumibacter solisilvae]|uniref:DUF1573 domain-containing protein n=1 Tax=Flavihumibacter solisilvae TaxID=1349421 RepID=UPI0009E2FC71|nr:DUF1573 domain-containing protein [Flavihumibacter solisilvae]
MEKQLKRTIVSHTRQKTLPGGEKSWTIATFVLRLYKIMRNPAVRLLIVAVSCFAGSLGLSAQTSGNDPLEISAAHDFGTIRHGRPVHYTFTLINRGTDSLRIEQVSASCGCTTPEWSKDPVPPRGTGAIKVGYNAAAEGIFEKTVTIVYNQGKSKTIVIKGQVGKPMSSAPVNSSVQLLKQTN